MKGRVRKNMFVAIITMLLLMSGSSMVKHYLININPAYESNGQLSGVADILTDGG